MTLIQRNIDNLVPWVVIGAAVSCSSAQTLDASGIQAASAPETATASAGAYSGSDLEFATQGAALTGYGSIYAATQAYTVSGCGDDHAHEEREDIRERARKRVVWQRPHRDKSETIRLLGFNDFHGQLSQGRTVSGRPVGGAAVLASYLKAAQAGFEGRSLIIHAGDHVGASPPASALLQDEPSIQFLNTLGNRFCSYRNRTNRFCNVVGTLGNHEFDEGASEMLRLINGGDSPLGPFLESPYRGANFGYVSANVVDSTTGKPLLAPYAIKKVGAVRVGVIGAVLKDTPTIVTPTGVAGLDFLDEADAINASVAELKHQGIHTLVVTIHQGGTQSSFEGPTADDGQVSGDILPILERLDDDVDVVISGHRHAFTNAIVTNGNGAPILVTQAFSASTAYAEIDLEISRRTGDVVAKSASVVTTYSDQAPGDVLDPEVQDLVAQAETLTAPLVNQVVGQAAIAVSRTQEDSGESALGNLIADAQRAAVGADFAFMNPGGIRADLDAGPITWGDLFTIQPFGNSLVQMDLTGAQVRTLLEQQWVGQTSPRLLQISGLEYTWDAAASDGSKVVSITQNGAPLDPAAVYTVVVNSFIAAGGDNFTVLVEGDNRIGGDVDLDALIAYIAGLSQPVDATVQGRITRLN